MLLRSLPVTLSLSLLACGSPSAVDAVGTPAAPAPLPAPQRARMRAAGSAGGHADQGAPRLDALATCP